MLKWFSLEGMTGRASLWLRNLLQYNFGSLSLLLALCFLSCETRSQLPIRPTVCEAVVLCKCTVLMTLTSCATIIGSVQAGSMPEIRAAPLCCHLPWASRVHHVHLLEHWHQCFSCGCLTPCSVRPEVSRVVGARPAQTFSP